MDVRSGRVLCDRARAWAALLPDRELSELERKLLDRHLAGCAGCRAFAHDVAAVTELIRKEELVPLPQPVSVPSWRRHSAIPGRLASLGAAAAVALMAIGIASRSPLPVTDESDTSQLQRVTDFGNNAPHEVAQIRKLRQVYVTPDNVLRLRPAMQQHTLPA
jgi:anti-sigma factor RsiW